MLAVTPQPALDRPAGPALGQAIDRLVSSALLPLDRLRSALLGPIGRTWREPIRDRDLRVALAGTLGVLTSLALTILAPLWLLALGPLVLGVPHLLSDVRYLVVRPGLHRRRLFLPLVALPLGISMFKPGLWVALCAVAGALVLARAPRPVRAAGIALVLAAAAAAYAGGYTVDVLFAHAHNAVALGLWWWWRPGRPRYQLAPIIASAIGVAALLLAGDALVHRLGSLAPPHAGLVVDTLALSRCPIADPAWSLRLVLAFAFAQSVHYGVWLRLLPDDARPRPGLRSFASSYRALAGDCGRQLVLGALVLVAALLLWGLSDLELARTAYLRMALFHGPLELAAIALLLVERRAPGAVAQPGPEVAAHAPALALGGPRA